MVLTVGVLALQGGFFEHLKSLQKAAHHLKESFVFVEVRTAAQLSTCDALIIPGGESTTLSLVAVQSGLLEPLRDFVKLRRKPTWGTCAGLILLSEEATAAKKGGQDLVGGLDVRIHRNHFGRQRESFVTDLDLEFLDSLSPNGKVAPFPAVFIRAPVVDRLLANDGDDKSAQHQFMQGVESHSPALEHQSFRTAKVEILAILPGRHASNKSAADGGVKSVSLSGDGDIVALRQGHVFGTSFHPELTDDIRIHVWWLQQVLHASKPI